MSTTILLAADFVGLGAMTWWTCRMYFGAARAAQSVTEAVCVLRRDVVRMGDQLSEIGDHMQAIASCMATLQSDMATVAGGALRTREDVS